MRESLLSCQLPRELLSPRLRLREPCSGDLPCFWSMDSDPEVMRFVQTPDVDRSAHRARFEAGLESGRFRHFRMIEWQHQAGPLGWVFLRPTEDGEWLELGYRQLPESWGKGVATEAAQLLIDVAMRDWGTRRVMALIMPGNQASRRVTEKLGLENRGLTDRYYGETLEFWALPD